MDENEASVVKTGEKKPPKQKKSHPIGRGMLALAVTLLLVAVAGLIFLFRDRLSGENLRALLREETPSAASDERFVYESGAGQVFAAAGNGLAMASSASIELMDGSGTTVFKQVVSYDTPAVFACEKAALFCDLGGETGVLAFSDAAREAVRLSPGGEILTASMNSSGWFTLTTAAAGYKGLVGVYNDEGALRYQWWSGAGYVLKAAVSPDNRMLAVLCAETGGGKLHLFRLDSEIEQAAAEIPGELPFDLAFFGADRVCLVGEKGLRFFDTDGAEKGSYDLGAYYLLDYDLGSQSFAVMFVSPYRTGGGGLIETVDRDGTLLGFAETAQNVTSLSASGRQVLAMTAGSLTLYGHDMEVQSETQGFMTAKRALLRPNGDALLLSAYSAAQLRF